MPPLVQKLIEAARNAQFRSIAYVAVENLRIHTRSGFWSLLDDHLGADRSAVIKIDHIAVDETEAARRH